MMISLIEIKTLKTLFISLFMLFFLAGCDADAPNHAIFRETLDPFHDQLEIGMSQADLDDLLAENSEISNYKYPYTSDNHRDFGYDEDREIDGNIYQVSMSGNPAGINGSSICFIKVLLVDDGEGGKHILNFGKVSCPA